MRYIFLPVAVVILLAAAFLRLYQLDTYPPGPHYDEAVNVLIGRSIAFGGADLFPIANSYQGRETLYHYLTAPFLATVVDDIFAFQIVSVFANMLTIAASMALGRGMFRGNRGIVIGLAIGVLMTVSFHQLWLSRQVYRAVTLPMMQALGLLFLWRGLVSSRSNLLILGGVFSAGALYTYMASRLFPVWLLLGGIILLWIGRNQWRQRTVQGGIFFGALVIAALPIVFYAVDNPDIFFNRLDEVSGGEVTVSLAESIQRHAEMFFIRGDFGNLRYNIPRRPYFTPIEGLLLLIGWGVALWRFTGVQVTVRAQHHMPLPDHTLLERAAYFLVLLSPLMVIPSVISVGGYPPSHMRSLGMVPLIFVLVAVGFEAVWEGMARYVSVLKEKPALCVAVGFLLLIGGVSVSRAYFAWAQRADLFYQADGDLAEAVQWLPDHIEGDTRVYIASYHREHPTVLIGRDQPVIWLGTDSLFFPPARQEGIVIFSHDTPPPPEWLTVLYPFQFDDVPLGPDGDPAFWAYRISSEMAAAFISETHLARNPLLTLLNVSSSSIPAGGKGEVSLIWRVEQTPAFSRLRPIVTLRNTTGVPLSSHDVFLSGTDQWLPGEIVIQRIPLDVPIGTPPGEYVLDVTWVDRDSDTYVSYTTADGEHAGIAIQAGSVTVVRPEQYPSPDTLPIQVRHSVDAVPGIRLLGWNPPPETARPGEKITSTLFWQAVPTEEERRLTYEVLLGENIIWHGESAYDSSRWINDEMVTEYALWTIPDDQPQGAAELLLRFADEEVRLLTIQIAGLPRIFDAPTVCTVLDTQFEDFVNLYGYTLEVDETIVLELAWTARGEPVEDYTVFVHLLDADGEIAAQFDRIPQNTYPTSLWIEGEYIIDRYEFLDIPPGEYRMRVGLYVQSNGKRLAIVDEGDIDYIELYDVMVKT